MFAELDTIDWSKYAMEGIAVGIAARVIPTQRLPLRQVLYIAGASAATLAILDTYAPTFASGARTGAGWTLGTNLVV